VPALALTDITVALFGPPLANHLIHLDSIRKEITISGMKAARRRHGDPCFSGVTCAPKPDRCELIAILNWKQATFCALVLVLSAIPLHAQRTTPAIGGPGNGASLPCNPAGYRCPGVQPEWKGMDTIPPLPTPAARDDDNCLPWKLSGGRATVVSVTSLKIPSNARREYQEGCKANSKKQFDEAEQHARSAIDKYQSYAAAWVLLGLVLEQQNKGPEASEACAHAAKMDSTYLPAYLCQAEFSIRNQEWQRALNLASLGLGLNSVGDGYIYYYRADAYFHLNILDDAKRSALQAEAIDVKLNENPLYFLLAQIYDAEGDSANAATQLRKILKHRSDPQQEDAAKQFLTRLDSPKDTN
jgi:hypothetical protein